MLEGTGAFDSALRGHHIRGFSCASPLRPYRYTACVTAPSSTRPSPVTPDAIRIDDALQRSPSLIRLQQLMFDSNQRFEAIRPLLPATLSNHVLPGPVNDEGWSLLAANAAVAAKLRQLQPRLEEALRDRGWRVSAIRVKVGSR